MRLLAPGIFLGAWSVLLVAAAASSPLHPRLAGVEGAAPLAADLQQAHRDGLDRPARFSARLPQTVLVLLVDFSDQMAAPNQTPASVDSLFFGSDQSLLTYYRRSSFGRYAPQGYTSSWIRAPQSLAFYCDARRGIGSTPGRNARALVAAAVAAADGTLDFARFDNDGPDGIPHSGDDDGMVDALVVVHAGEAAEVTGSANDLLSHSWTTEQRVDTADGVFLWTYSLVSIASPLGVRVHEFGHLLGLPDLYDQSALSRQGPGGLGDWSLMGSGSWLGDGAQPADLDAPSKIELGFVDPIVPSSNATGLELRASIEHLPGTVYQIWTHGMPKEEFFVVENRRPQGLDALLPGGGMLVYHVDLRRVDNDDRDWPRVRLLQADGRSDLENFVDPGDAGDPYPGSGSVCCRLDGDTAPGTRANDGKGTQIIIDSISIPTATMHFDLQIEDRPFLRILGQTLREIGGDGDGIPEAGEDLALQLTLENLGMPSGPMQLTWRAEPASAASWSLDETSLPPLDKGESTAIQLALRPDPSLGDPAGLEIVGIAPEVFDPGSLRRLLPLGESRGFQACLHAGASRFTRDCSDPDQPWSSLALQGVARWSLESPEGSLSQVYRSAWGSRYANDADMVLVSPPFNLAPGSELMLLHAYAMQDLEAGWCADGGRVEISLDGGDWEVLAPQGGYPRRLDPRRLPALAGEGVFGGQASRRWDIFELDERHGSARLRFRFVSDDSIGERGWEIHRVEVHLTRTQATIPSVAVLAEPNPARLPTPIRFRIDAAPQAAAQTTRLRLFDLRGRLVRILEHPAVPSQSGQFVWDGTDRAGRPVPTGLYVARLDWGTTQATTKILVIR